MRASSVVTIGADYPVESLAVHDETNLARATALARLGGNGRADRARRHLSAPAGRGEAGLSQLAPTPPMSREELAALLSQRELSARRFAGAHRELAKFAACRPAAWRLRL